MDKYLYRRNVLVGVTSKPYTEGLGSDIWKENIREYWRNIFSGHRYTWGSHSEVSVRYGRKCIKVKTTKCYPKRAIAVERLGLGPMSLDLLLPILVSSYGQGCSPNPLHMQLGGPVGPPVGSPLVYLRTWTSSWHRWVCSITSLNLYYCHMFNTNN